MSMAASAPQSERTRPKVAVFSGVMSIENARLSLFLDALVRDGFDVVAILPAYSESPHVPVGVRYRPLRPPQDHFWPGSRLGGIVRALRSRWVNLRRIAKMLKEERPQIYHAVEPDAWWLAVRMKRRDGGKVVADVREVYEDRATAFPGPFRGLVRWSVTRLLQSLARRSDRIIHVSRPRMDHYGFPAELCAVVPHYAHRIERLEPGTRPADLQGKEIVMHAGSLRTNYAAANILCAMEVLHARRPQAVLVVLGGHLGGSEGYADKLAELSASGVVRLLPRVPHAEVLRWMRCSDVGINLVLPIDNTHRLASPLKLYEYVSMGLPVVGADLPEIREVIAGTECGVLVDPMDPEVIAAGIEQVLSAPERARQMGVNARRAHLERLNWETIREQYLEIYRRLA